MLSDPSSCVTAKMLFSEWKADDVNSLRGELIHVGTTRLAGFDFGVLDCGVDDVRMARFVRPFGVKLGKSFSFATALATCTVVASTVSELAFRCFCLPLDGVRKSPKHMGELKLRRSRDLSCGCVPRKLLPLEVSRNGLQLSLHDFESFGERNERMLVEFRLLLADRFEAGV